MAKKIIPQTPQTSTPTDQITLVEEKLKQLYDLQCIDSKIDALRVLQGELPLEVKDLEREIAEIGEQLNKCNEGIKEVEELIAQEKEKIFTSNALISRYKTQIDEVRNNREHEALQKEIEFQHLEIELSEKKIRSYGDAIVKKEEQKAELDVKSVERGKNLLDKQNALEEIINETKKEVDALRSESDKCRISIDIHLLAAYDRVRSNARNGLAVVLVQRGACGGCFYHLPPQRQVDIKMSKKITVCEYCGRFLVSEDIIRSASEAA
jgi:predicted  nucleic acid-binding Zn-ribbon protein